MVNEIVHEIIGTLAIGMPGRGSRMIPLTSCIERNHTRNQDTTTILVLVLAKTKYIKTHMPPLPQDQQYTPLCYRNYRQLAYKQAQELVQHNGT